MDRPQNPAPARNRPRLLDDARERHSAAALQHPTEQVYVDWIARFIVFRGKQHPEEREAVAGETFLITLAVRSNVASSTQNHAPNAIVFLYW